MHNLMFRGKFAKSAFIKWNTKKVSFIKVFLLPTVDTEIKKKQSKT
jgi:hypothetical protein